MIDHGHDLGTLRAEVQGELEWLRPVQSKQERRETISVLAELRNMGAI